MIKLALVGRGPWGKNYIRTIKEIPNCQLPANYIKTTDYPGLFKQKDIAGVIIATPPSTHYQIARDFLERGFNVLIEKPLTTSHQDALKLGKIADRRKTVAMVGHIYLYHPAFIEMKRSINKLGQIYYIMSEGMDYGPIRTDVSVLWDWASHDIAMAIDLISEKPVAVAAWNIKNDMVMLRLDFDDGVSTFSTFGWLSPIKKRNVIVVGQKGAVAFDDIAPKKVIYFGNLGGNPKISYPSYSPELPLKLEVLEFIDCIEKKRRPKTDLDQGIFTVKIIEAAEKSINSNGKPIKML